MIDTVLGPDVHAAGLGGPDGNEFMRLAVPYQHELVVHCHRILGSFQAAEDLVQETYLRAWRAYDRFEGRLSLRVWLYRIATSACLTALEHHGLRLLPTGLGAPSADPDRTPLPVEGPETPWVQPLPASLANDPAAIVASRDSVRLVFVAALQHLSAKQRAVLILRDVMEWKAAEVAEALELTVVAVNSALRRARAHLKKAAPTDSEPTEPNDLRYRDLLERYTSAFARADVSRLVRLLHDDVVLEMPPLPGWYSP